MALPWIVIDKQNKRVEAFWEIPKDVEDAMKFFPDSFDKMLMGAYVKAKKQEEKIAKQEKEKLLKKEVK